jgi:hypothetical protein
MKTKRGDRFRGRPGRDTFMIQKDHEGGLRS